MFDLTGTTLGLALGAYVAARLVFGTLWAVVGWIVWRVAGRETVLREYVKALREKRVPLAQDYDRKHLVFAGNLLTDFSTNPGLEPEIRANCAFLAGELQALTQANIVGFFQAMRYETMACEALRRHFDTLAKAGHKPVPDQY